MTFLTGLRVMFNIPKKVTVGFVVFDATVREVHSQENQITDHPVESGSDITDHVIRRPERLQLQGIVSGTPINLVSVGPLAEARPQAAFEELSRLRREGELVTVTTSLKIYPDMLIEALTVERSTGQGRALHFSLQLRQVNTVASQRLLIQEPDNPTDAKEISQGTRPTTAPSSGQSGRSQSALTSAIDGVLRIFGG